MKKKILLLSLGALLAVGGIGATSAGILNSNQPTYAEDADDGKCQAALDLINLNVDVSQIVSSFRLPYIGQYNATITWVSSNTSVVSIVADSAAGKVASVKRGDADVQVTLTATATLTGSKSASKDFVLTVLKKSATQGSDLPLALDEDFTDYATGIELSNYFKWQSSSAEMSAASTTEEVSGNINNMVSKKALAIQSVRTASSLTYTRQINVQSSALPSDTLQAVLEGYVLFSGDTNGVGIELTNGSGSVVAGAAISSSHYSFFESGAYVKSTIKTPEEGVWQRIRLVFKPSVGRLFFYVYDWNSASWIDLTAKGASYSKVSGIASNNSGDITGLRINVMKGSNFGTTYLSNFKIDTLANLPEATPTNPNRSMGIGNITNYNETIFANTGETVSGLNPDFAVHNRFNESVTLTKDTDYTVTSTNSKDEDGSDLYVYTFTLVSTGEVKTIQQHVYYSAKTDKVTITAFKGSYLKSRKVTSGTTVTTYGYITLSGYVNRGDGTLFYAILTKGSAAPKESDLTSNNSAIPGYISGGNQAITTHTFAVDSDSISYSGEYDVYAIITNTNGSSEIYSSTGISTIVNITSCEEFYQMSHSLDTLASTFRLMNDLDFSSYYWEFDSATRNFTGTLDGQGHTVKNLTISNASNDTTVKTGIFFNFNGTVKNIAFANAKVYGMTDVGILGGNSYGCTVENASFTDCTVAQESSLSGGDGYFATLIGRCRGDINTFTNVTIDNSTIASPQRSGLLVAGAVAASNACTLNLSNIVVDGNITEQGAHAGLIGRNQGATITVNKALISLEVRYAKKEVGAVLGRNETGGSLKADNVFSDLRIKDMTQPTYFGQFIGYDATTTGSYGKSFAYSASGISYLNNDYSDLGDSITPIKNAITCGIGYDAPEEYTARWWETHTFLRDLDVSTAFVYDETSAKPVLKARTSAEISAGLTAQSFETWTNQIDLNAIEKCHYVLYKAEDVYNALSATEKAKVSATSLAKLAEGKAAYISLVETINKIGGNTAF